MKRILLIVTALLILSTIMIGCDTSQNAPKEPEYQEIVAEITEVNENSLLVRPTSGLSDIDIIYLNFDEEVILNISESAPLEPGTIVTAKVGIQIMESSPPQVILYEIINTEKSDDSDQAASEYVGVVESITGETYGVKLLDGDNTPQVIEVVISQELQSTVDKIEIGYIVGITATADDDKYIAQSILYSQPNQIIKLDDREKVSGYLNGMFPQTIYTMNDSDLKAEKDIPFAIAMPEQSKEPWTITEQEHIKLVAEEVGGTETPIRYFGISVDTPGEYELKFTLSLESGDITTHTFKLIVK